MFGRSPSASPSSVLYVPWRSGRYSQNLEETALSVRGAHTPSSHYHQNALRSQNGEWWACGRSVECGQCINPYPTRTACHWDHTQVRLSLIQLPMSSWQQTLHPTPFAVPNVTIYLWTTVLTNKAWLTHPTHECDTINGTFKRHHPLQVLYSQLQYKQCVLFSNTWSCAWDILNPVTIQRSMSLKSKGCFGLQSRCHFLFRLFWFQETDRSRYRPFPTFFSKHDRHFDHSATSTRYLCVSMSPTLKFLIERWISGSLTHATTFMRAVRQVLTETLAKGCTGRTEKVFFTLPRPEVEPWPQTPSTGLRHPSFNHCRI